MAVSAITRLAPAPQRSWFSLHNLFPANLLRPVEPWFYGLLLVSFVFLLRVSESLSLTPSTLGPDRLGLRAAKRDRVTCWRPATHFVSEWLAFLGNYLASYSLPTAAALNHLLRALAPDCTWHALRRGGAATLVQLGTSPEQLSHWGRWASSQSARPYFDLQCPFSSLPSRFHLYSPTFDVLSASPFDLWPPVVLPGPTLSSPPCRNAAALSMSATSTPMVRLDVDEASRHNPALSSPPSRAGPHSAGDTLGDTQDRLPSPGLDVPTVSAARPPLPGQSSPGPGRGRKRVRAR